MTTRGIVLAPDYHGSTPRPLGRTDDGAIITPPSPFMPMLTDQGMKICPGDATQLNPIELRRSALYFDKIVLPLHSMIYDSVSDHNDVRTLIDESRMEIQTRTGSITAEETWSLETGNSTAATSLASVYADMQVETYRDLIKRNDGCQWAIGQTFEQLIVPDDKSLVLPSLSFELHKAVPVFEADTPIDEILRYKDDSEAELKNLWNHIDGIVRSFASVTDAAYIQYLLDDHRLAIRDAVDDMRRAIDNRKWKITWETCKSIVPLPSDCFLYGAALVGVVETLNQVFELNLGVQSLQLAAGIGAEFALIRAVVSQHRIPADILKDYEHVVFLHLAGKEFTE